MNVYNAIVNQINFHFNKDKINNKIKILCYLYFQLVYYYVYVKFKLLQFIAR